MCPVGATEGDQIKTGDDLDVWEHRLDERVASDTSAGDNERGAIIRARPGQGLFKERVMAIERRCRITGVENPIHLVASHCKAGGIRRTMSGLMGRMICC